MEINYLVDLTIFKSAPQLSKSQAIKLLEELEPYIFDADWITIGIMASHDYDAVKALQSISKKYSSIKFRGLDSLHADGSVFLKEIKEQEMFLFGLNMALVKVFY